MFSLTCCPSRCFLIFFGRRFQAIQIYAGGAESPHQRVHPLVVRIRSVFGLWRQKDHSHRATTDPTSGCSGMDDDDSYGHVGGRHWIFDQLPTMEFGYLFGYLVWLWCCYDGFLHRNWRWNGQMLICTWHAKQECFLFFVTAVTFSLHLFATRKDYANIISCGVAPETWSARYSILKNLAARNQQFVQVLRGPWFSHNWCSIPFISEFTDAKSFSVMTRVQTYITHWFLEIMCAIEESSFGK